MDARSAPKPLSFELGCVSDVGTLVFSMLVSGVNSLPKRPNLRRSRGSTSLRYASNVPPSSGMSLEQPSSHAFVPSSFMVQ